MGSAVLARVYVGDSWPLGEKGTTNKILCYIDFSNPIHTKETYSRFKIFASYLRHFLTEELKMWRKLCLVISYKHTDGVFASTSASTFIANIIFFLILRFNMISKNSFFINVFWYFTWTSINLFFRLKCRLRELS